MKIPWRWYIISVYKFKIKKFQFKNIWYIAIFYMRYIFDILRKWTWGDIHLVKWLLRGDEEEVQITYVRVGV